MKIDRPCCLSIAGYDSTVGAGVLAEIVESPFHGKSKHGRGCELSKVVVSCLANVNLLTDKCIQARTYVEQ